VAGLQLARRYATLYAESGLLTRCSEGYALLRYRDPSGRIVRVREHKLLAELECGKKAKLVHHIDGCKDNNHPSNLWVFDSQNEHLASHKTFDNLLPALLQSGVVRFDRATGAYLLKATS
jgi:hypothetical protein